MVDVDLVVMVDEKRGEEIDQLAKTLEDKGCHIQQKLPRFRTIVCTGDSSLMKTLKSVEGVEMVRLQQKFQLPPMDEKIPQ